MVFVSSNYRLGPLGWFFLEGLNEDSTEPLDRSANFGTLDLIAALKWVKAHIAAFGGDPDNVTIFGESAGARNVMSLLVARQSKGLFKRGIAQSGYLTTDKLADIKKRTQEIVKKAYQKADQTKEFKLSAAAKDDPKQVGSLLRSLNAGDFLSLYRLSQGDQWLEGVADVISDGIVIPKKGLHRAFREGDLHDVEMIFGATRDEEKLFMASDDRFVQGIPVISRFIPWVRIRDTDVYRVHAKALSESWYYWGVVLPSRFLAKKQAFLGLNRVYAYRFDWDEQPKRYGMDISELYAAAHSLEIAFIFGLPTLRAYDRDPSKGFRSVIDRTFYDPNKRDSDYELANQMGRYWVNFAYDGNPNQYPYTQKTRWEAWEAEQFLVFDSFRDKGIKMYLSSLSEASILQRLENSAILNHQRCKTLHDLLSRSLLNAEEKKKVLQDFMLGTCQ